MQYTGRGDAIAAVFMGLLGSSMGAFAFLIVWVALGEPGGVENDVFIPFAIASAFVGLFALLFLLLALRAARSALSIRRMRSSNLRGSVMVRTARARRGRNGWSIEIEGWIGGPASEYAMRFSEPVSELAASRITSGMYLTLLFDPARPSKFHVDWAHCRDAVGWGSARLASDGAPTWSWS